MAGYQSTPAPGQWFDAASTAGRALEAIVLFHECCRDELAATVAGRIAAAHLRNTTGPDGRVRKEILDSAHVGHNHSCLGTLRGLLLYGLWTGRNRAIAGNARIAAVPTLPFDSAIAQGDYSARRHVHPPLVSGVLRTAPDPALRLAPPAASVR